MKTGLLHSLRDNRRFRLSLKITSASLWLVGVAVSLLISPTLGSGLRTVGVIGLITETLLTPTLLAWTFVSMLAGVEVGISAPHIALQLRLPGDLFLRMIRMIIAPLLFTTITTGIAGHGQLRQLGRVAVKSILYFEIVTTIGLIIGGAVMNYAGIGWGVRVDQSRVVAPQAAVQTWQQVLLNIFPENIAQAVAQNQILQVAIFSVLFGAALALLGEEQKLPLVRLLQALAGVMFKITRFALFLAPLAAGGALAYTIANSGLGTLLPLFKLVVGFYVALAIFTFFVQIPTLLIFRIPVGRFLHAIAEPVAIGFATTTSEAALPLAIERTIAFGTSSWIASFVIPTGYSFNMTGASIYLSMATVFCAQASGIQLSFAQQAVMFATLILASKGVAGVPRAVLVVLLATASSIQLPTAPILLIMGVDALIDMGRTAMNIAGNCLAAVIIAKSENELDLKYSSQRVSEVCLK